MIELAQEVSKDFFLIHGKVTGTCQRGERSGSMKAMPGFHVTAVSCPTSPPLAVVSLRVDALAHQDGKEDLRRGVRGLSHLVSQMLDLERLSLLSGQSAPVDLTLCRDMVADLHQSLSIKVTIYLWRRPICL